VAIFEDAGFFYLFHAKGSWYRAWHASWDGGKVVPRDVWVPLECPQDLLSHFALFAFGERFVQKRLDVGLVRQPFLFSLFSS
jgi:hypothetical protein